MLIYLLKANLVLAFLYIFYRLLFSRDTFFNCRRALLMGIVTISLLAPLSWLQVLTGGWLPEETARAVTAEVLPESIVMPDAQVTTQEMWPATVAGWAYAAGVALLLGHIAVQLGGLLRLSRCCPRTVVDGVVVHVLPAGGTPFSFFRRIFVCPKEHRPDELAEILAHEQTHARQWHSADVLVGEVMCAFCWFNPFAWLLKREIRQNLEYLADRHVLAEGYDRKRYQYHLLGVAYHKAAATIYNNFNVLPLKKRISMMNKKRTNNIGRLKYLLFLPVATLLAAACSGNQKQVQDSGTDEPAMTETTNPQAQPKATDTATADTAQATDMNLEDTPPQFPGGPQAMYEFIAKNLVYPSDAKEAGKQGQVVCQFIVTDEGKITDIEILRSVSPSIDKEAIRVIQAMPTWIPGRQNGKNADMKCVIPVRFRMK